MMRRGSRDEFVTELQGNLNTLGYGPLTTGGVFGASTERAVKSSSPRLASRRPLSRTDL